MHKKFITNLGLLLFLNLLIKPFWILGIDRSVQNAIGSGSYGVYYALFNFTFLFNIILDLGITNFNNKNIAQNNHLLNKHLSSIIMLRGLLAIVYGIITLSFGFFIGYDSSMLKLLMALIFNQLLISFILYLRSNIAGLHLFKTDSFLSILDRLIMIIIMSLILWGHVLNEPLNIKWYVLAQSISYFITAMIVLAIVVKKAKLKKIKWNWIFFRMILKKSYPYAILVLLMSFYNRIDTVMLERMLPDGAIQSGIYAAAYRLLDASNMIAFLFSGLLLPMFARMLKFKESVEDLVMLSFTLLITPAVIVSVGSFFYRHELMQMLYQQHIEESATIFGVLMSCFTAISMTYIFGTLLTANGNLKQLNIMAASGMALNILINYLLIPHYKATGSAFSSLFTQFLTAFAQIAITQYIFKFRINYRLILRLSIFVFVTILSFYASKQFQKPWMFSFSIAVAISILSAFIIRLIHLKNIYKMFRAQ